MEPPAPPPGLPPSPSDPSSWLPSLIAALPPILYRTWRNFLRQHGGSIHQVPFSQFLLDANNDRVNSVIMSLQHFDVTLKPAVACQATEMYRTQVVPLFDRQSLIDLLISNKVTFGTKSPSWTRRLGTIFLGVFPFLYLALVYKLVNRMYNPSDSVGKQQVKKGGRKRRVTFADVAGVDTAKLELAELVDFLRDRSRYVAIGAKLPKGVLLSGPSGTGKTLLARAVASESGVSFISASASEFVEMLVGRGAARVRDLFQRGASNAPSIIFIDELDALGRQRGGLSSNDEREQTLNQLLTEMDGFDSQDNSVVVMAATNRPEVLDPALTRPGRFDRHVHVGLPDTRGRRAILEVHVRDIRLGPDVDLHRVAVQTRGFSGAELANLVNEAALLAVRGGGIEVSHPCFEAAMDKARQSRALTGGR